MVQRMDYLGGKEVNVEGTVLHLNGERDADAPNFVTLTEPTGISTYAQRSRNYTMVAVITAVTAAGVMIYTRKKLKK